MPVECGLLGAENILDYNGFILKHDFLAKPPGKKTTHKYSKVTLVLTNKTCFLTLNVLTS